VAERDQPALAPLRSSLRKGPRFAQIIAQFVTALPRMAEEIRAHADAGELDRVARLAHRLKGSAGGYGFPDIVQVAATLERDARHDDAAQVARGSAALLVLCERARVGAEEATL